MTVMPICRQPIVDYAGGTVVSLHVTGVLCEDPTAFRGAWPFAPDGLGHDSLRLTGALTTQVGADGAAEVRTLVPQNLGTSAVDRHPALLDRELHRFFVPDGTAGPSAAHATLLLAAEDWSGTTRDAAAQDVIKALAPTLADAMGAVVGQRAKEDQDGGMFGWSVPGVDDTVRGIPNEDFAPVQTSFLVPGSPSSHVAGHEVVVAGLGGRAYRLTLQWRARRLPAVDDVLNLQVHYGEFVVAEGGGRQMLVANRPSPSDWETFGLVRLGGDRVALLAPNGDFLSAEAGGGREIFAGRAQIGEWEVFRVEEVMTDRIALRAFNGHYVSAYHGGGHQLVASRPVRDEYEVFTLHRP
ncbi:hypothetical protein [Cellulomonas sp. Leaf334]|uniref:fascin domain-containing protein n=1 Tax=Cellulomonas sp. Leaf334 TaxID=1736339 RepID=UPI0006F9A11D|nr:hypothetical protein [Cellulomonas sp. Leaf334]KQR17337.1 hypothetical protein ASF78_08620 [Cellulomonas sp. Leaf334]